MHRVRLSAAEADLSLCSERSQKFCDALQSTIASNTDIVGLHARLTLTRVFNMRGDTDGLAEFYYSPARREAWFCNETIATRVMNETRATIYLYPMTLLPGLSRVNALTFYAISESPRKLTHFKEPFFGGKRTFARARARPDKDARRENGSSGK